MIATQIRQGAGSPGTRSPRPAASRSRTTLYRQVMEQRPVTAPTLFLDSAGEPWTLQPGVRDATLFHPRSVYEAGRPTWLHLGGTREPHALPAGVCGSEARVLVEARVAGEAGRGPDRPGRGRRRPTRAGPDAPAREVRAPGRSAADELLASSELDVTR